MTEVHRCDRIMNLKDIYKKDRTHLRNAGIPYRKMMMKERHMTIEERAEQAVALKNRSGYNCAQAVAEVLADQTGLTEEQLYSITSGFGLGMGTMQATCGALVGAGVAAGLKMKGMGTVSCTKQILTEFKSMCGAVTCGDLKSKTDGKVLCSCDDCVRNAVKAYGKVMGI